MQIYKHRTTQGTYKFICEAVIEASMVDDIAQHVIVYQNALGQCITRPKREFEDGRFTCIWADDTPTVVSHNPFSERSET